MTDSRTLKDFLAVAVGRSDGKVMVGRSDGRTVGRCKAYAARARKRGSKPTLTSASPPAFTNTRLLIVMVTFPSDCQSVRLSDASLPLKLRSADRQPDRQRAGLQGIVDVR